MDYSTYDLDFSDEGRRRVHAFSYVLGYSRRQYLHFVEAQDFATTVREHIRAFEHLGGVAATCLYDNMKVVVSGYDGDDPVYNPRFLAFAAHYGFRPVACRPRRPQTKGKVERPFGYVESSLLGGRTFRGLEHLNETAAWWLAEVADVRVHRQTKARPIDRHAEERPHLIPLPAQPFDASEVVVPHGRRRGIRGLPPELLRGALAADRPERRGAGDRGRAGDPRQGLRRSDAASRSCRGPPRASAALARTTSRPATRNGEASNSRRDFAGVRRDRARASWRACSPATGPARTRPNASCRWRRPIRARDVLAALERAVRYGAFSLAAVQRILAARGRPKTPLDALADDHRTYLDRLLDGQPTPPRPTSDYQALLGEGPHDAEATDPAPERSRPRRARRTRRTSGIEPA